MIGSVVILCGGRGSRLKPITENIPKPMADINNKPFLEYLIKQVSLLNPKDIILLTGYKSDVIESYYLNKNNKKNLIKIFKSHPDLDTGSRFYKFFNKYNFPLMLCYGDNLVNFDIKEYFKNFVDKNALIVKTSKQCKEVGNINLKNNSRVNYSKNRNMKFKYVDLGYFIFQKEFLSIFKPLNSTNISFSKILEKMCKFDLFCYRVKGKYLSITNIDLYNKTVKYLKNDKNTFFS